MQVAATLRYARVSPQKCRLVADVIRGKTVDEALRVLTFSPKKSARIVKKILESAVANAEHNHGADIDELKVATPPMITSALPLTAKLTDMPARHECCHRAPKYSPTQEGCAAHRLETS